MAKLEELTRGASVSTLADTLFRLLGNGPMKMTEFHSHTNETADNIREALEQLESDGRIRKTILKHEGRGRPAECWGRVEN